MTYHSDNNKPILTRQSSLDVMKCVAALFVVFIHCDAEWFSPVIRSAVPIFFLISGYYYPQIGGVKFTLHIRKVLTMAISASAIYGLYTFISVLRHDTLARWIDITFTLRHLAFSFLTDTDIFSGHLWYFWAIVYDLIFLRLLDKFRLSRYLSYMVPILLLIFFVFNFTPYNRLMRNWLFMGLPCICVGRWIREDDKKWLKVFSSSYNCIAIGIISFALVCLEFYIDSVVLNYCSREMYVFTLPLIMSVFCMALRNPEFGQGTFLSEIGRRYSAVIYIIHALVIVFLRHLLSVEGWLADIFFAIIVFGISLFVAMLWERLKTVVVPRINKTKTL